VRRTHIGETARKGAAGVRALLLGATELAKAGNVTAEGLRERHGGQTLNRGGRVKCGMTILPRRRNAGRVLIVD
jgi:hypothetical protein